LSGFIIQAGGGGRIRPLCARSFGGRRWKYLKDELFGAAAVSGVGESVEVFSLEVFWLIGCS
jgi:hypothetical protein